METILQHNIFEEPVECNVQACLGDNKKHGTANHTEKTRRFKNSKHDRHIGVYGRTAHSRRQFPRRHRSSKNIKRLTKQTIETINDREFSQDEVRQINGDFIPRKAPAPDGIISDILTLVFKNIPKTVTLIYNECLKRGYFPNEWKIAKIIPITKPGKEDSQDPSKYRLISLLNIGGKEFENY